jgi:predicted dehydrogenase
MGRASRADEYLEKEPVVKRFGVIGAGIWGTMHARAYAQCGDAELAAVCDLDLARARGVVERFGAPGARAVDSVDALLACGLDAVSVATPDASHADIVIRAAERGLHILVEKPLATTVEECKAMVAAADKAGVILLVDWHNRWNPPYHHAREAIRAGELGDVRYVYYRLSDAIYVATRMLPWASRSSVIWFLGSHALDTTCWLIGRRPVRVSCRTTEGVLKGLGVDTPDLFVTMVDFEGGALAVIENLWILPDSAPALIDHKCQVVGTRGIIQIDPTHNRSYEKHTDRRGVADGGGAPDWPLPDMFVAPEIHGRQMGFAVESIYHFARCVARGGQPLATGRDGLVNTTLIRAALRSVDEGRPVDVTL